MGARPGYNVRFLGTGMSTGTRSKANKNKVEDLYKTALETPDKRKAKPDYPIYTSTPAETSFPVSRPVKRRF